MITIVPDKRNTPLLGSPPPHRLRSQQKQVLGGKTVHVYSWCKFAGGYETVPGEIRGRLLKISYDAYTKKRASRCGAKLVRSSRDSSRSLTKKLSYSSQHSTGFTGMKCDANFSFLIIFEYPLPLTGITE